MTPLAALEETAEPDATEFTERVQPVTEVPIAVVLLRVVKSKFAFLIRPVSVLFDVDALLEELLSEEESVSSVQAANIAPAEETIITDKRRARNLLLRLLFVVFI